MSSPEQILDGNGRPIYPTPWSQFAPGQVVAYTGTSGMIVQAIGTAYAQIVSDGTAPADGSTVTVGSKTYTFKTALTPAEGEVLINVTAAAALLNLHRAITHTGTPNTDYKAAAASPDVTSTTPSSTVLTVSALLPGSYANGSVAITGLGISGTGVNHVTFKDVSGNVVTGLLGGDDSTGPRLFLVNCSTAAYFKVASYTAPGTYPTAANTDVPIAAGVPQPVWMFPGSRVAAVQQAAGGNLTVTEILG